MTVNYYLDSRNKGELKSIRIFIRSENITFKFAIGEKINPKFWDVKKQLAKRSYIGHPELNSYLNSLKEKIKRRLRLLSLENEILTNDMIKSEVENILTVKKPIDSKKIFFDSFNQFIEVKKNEKRERTIQKYNTLIEHLRNFEKSSHYKLSFDKINLQFYEKFTAYLMNDLLHSNNTIGKYISSLKTFLHWAVERGFNTHFDFTKFKVFNDKSDIVVMSEDELMKLYYLDFNTVDIKEKNLSVETLNKVRDVFCFQAFTGQRFSDIESLKRDDIKNDSWYLHTYKTKDIIEIPLTPLAKEILNKYKNDSKPLPVISHQKTNNIIKDACELAEINEPLTVVKYRGKERIETKKPKYNFITTHTARRTFVTLSLEKGMKADTIMEITGHTSYKTFKKYVKITSKVKHQEMNKYWKKPSHLKVINFK